MFVAGTSVNPTITGTTVDEEVAEMQRPHVGAEATWQIVAVEPPRRFAYRWHPFAVDANVDYSNEPTTLVEFTLSETADGVLLRIVEPDRRHPRDPPRRRVRSQQRRMGQADRPGAQKVPEPGAAGVTATLAAAPV